MRLFDFQEQAVHEVVQFLAEAKKLSSRLGEDIRFDPYQVVWSGVPGRQPYHSLIASDGKPAPSLCVSIPTGGGKTLVGLSCLAELRQKLSFKPFCLWLVPNDAIYSQLHDRLKTETFFGGLPALRGTKVRISTVQSPITPSDLEGKDLNILLLTIQSVVRHHQTRNLNIFKPRDELRFLLAQKQFKGASPSLFELIRFYKPMVVVDEAHRISTGLGRSVLAELNPSVVLELTATPKAIGSGADRIEPNILFTATGRDLVSNQLIKNPIEYRALTGASIKETVHKAVLQQRRIEKVARGSGLHLIPKVLISTQFTDKRFKDTDSSTYAVRNMLLDLGVPSAQTAARTSTADDVSGRDLDNPSEQIRFILTKKALMEGWDCKSVYVVVLLNNIGASVTNVQLVGRGMRQPFQRYFRYPMLNRLYVLTNSSRHDRAVRDLQVFLADSGLGDAAIEFTQSSIQFTKTTFPLEDAKWNKCVPQLITKDDKNVARRLALAKTDALHKMQPLNRHQISSMDSKGEHSTTLDMSDLSLGVQQFRDVALPREATARDIALDLTRALHHHFPSTVKAHRIFMQVCQKLVNEGVLPRELQAKFEGLSGLLENEIAQACLDALSSEVERCMLDGLITIQLPSDHDALPPKVTYACNAQTERQLRMFTKNIYGNIPKTLFNAMELDFAYFIESQGIDGWLRNDPNEVGLYFHAGPLRVYPDFFVFSSNARRLLVVVVETKGAHLVDSSDSKRKKKLFDVLNKISGEKAQFVIGTFDHCRSEIVRHLSEKSLRVGTKSKRARAS